MLAAREEQSNLATLPCGNDTAGENACPLRFVGFIVDIPPQTQHLHGRVVVVQHVALCRLTDQLVKDRCDADRNGTDDLPLHRSRQGNTQAVLHLL
jgi:hypothetical protein